LEAELLEVTKDRLLQNKSEHKEKGLHIGSKLSRIEKIRAREEHTPYLAS
jgi:hypothetical protein